MSITEVVVAPTLGPVTLRVAEQKHPQSVVAAVWRFNGPTRREGLAGEVTRERPEIPLGAPTSIAGKGFVVDGFVIPFMDDPPSPYQVVVTVLQGGTPLHQAVPADHGAGSIGDEEVRFRYPFTVRVA